MTDKSKWGIKRTCPKCSGKFYDLNKNPILCPVCGAEFDLEEFNKHSIAGKMKKAKPTSVDLTDDIKLSDEETEMLEEVLDTSDDELTLIEDTSEISDDTHDMAEVIGNIDKNPLAE